MKKIFTFIALIICFVGVSAEDYKSKTWAQICSGVMDTEWYGSAEAISVADTLLGVQKTNGGWMKNDQFHNLTATELSARKALDGTDGRSAHSCFDNYATTQEMRFLAKVYNQAKLQRHLDAFKRALNLIFTAGNSLKGGWGQYWPLSDDKYSYQNYITFNDDLMTNMLRILQEIYEEKGDFNGLVDEDTRTRCKEQWEKALECVLNCQINDNGVKAGWCAQHDPEDFLPTEGRPHELPSVSGSESATLLSYLMSINKPSEQLQQCITSAVEWFKAHKYKENAAIEDYTNANGEDDRHIIEKSGSNLWGRFIQIGGESGKAIYNKFYNKLKERGKTRAHHTTGYVYYEYQILEASYDAEKEYQPIFAIYTNDYPELFYRHLYNYDDTSDAADKYGQTVATSLKATNRRSYQYLGSWLDATIKAYDLWKARVDAENEAGDYETFVISSETYSSENPTYTWNFQNGFSISTNEKAYAAGQNSTVKYSVADYTMAIPTGKRVEKVHFAGYDNYAGTDSYIKSLNGEKFTDTQYVFPAKETSGTEHYVSHIVPLSSPATGTLTFSIGGKQTCLIITVYCSATEKNISLPAEYTYSTFSSTAALDFTDNSDVEAYTAKANGSTVTLTKVEKVPANTGLILKKLGDATTATIATVPMVESVDAIADNDLVAVTTPVTAEELIAAGNAYILVSDTQFAKVVEGASGELAAGKAYLRYSNKNNAPMMLSFGEAASVNGVRMKAAQTDNAIYNLLGIRVDKPTAKGLYIINGKKHLYK
ncbi:MAG: pectate lyase [Prevotella sp.]